MTTPIIDNNNININYVWSYDNILKVVMIIINSKVITLIIMKPIEF